MRVAEEKKQRKIRRKASSALLVYDLHSNLPMGQILDMSAKGMKLMTEEPVAIYQIYYCRIPLDKKIKKRKEIFFDAECRWCKFSEETGWYNSGYLLRFPSPKEAEIVQELTRAWMVDEYGKLKTKASKPEKDKPGLLRKIFGS
jgi:hypothetical protein